MRSSASRTSCGACGERRQGRSPLPALRGDRPGEPGGALRHRLRHRHHHPGVRAAVRAVRHRGAPVRAARHRLHRLDPGLARHLDHGDAGALLLPAAGRCAVTAHGDSLAGRASSRPATRGCSHWAFRRPRIVYAVVAFGVVAARRSARSLLPRAFLPPFNEGTLLVNLLLQPRHLAGRVQPPGHASPSACCCEIPEVKSRRPAHRPGRARRARRGRPLTEIDVDLARSERSRRRSFADIRAKLARAAGLAVDSASRSRTASTTCCRACARRSRQDLRRRPRHAARPRRAAARAPGSRAGPRRPAGREAGADPAAQGHARLRARGPLRRHARRADRGAGSPARTAASSRRSSRATAASTWSLRLSDENRSTTGLQNLLVSTPQGVVPLQAARQGRGGRRPQPDPARERPAPHRRAGQRRRPRDMARDRRRHPPRRGRDRAAGRLRHAGSRGHSRRRRRPRRSSASCRSSRSR